MTAPKPKTDSPFAARASTRAPFPTSTATGTPTPPPPEAPVRQAVKGRPPWLFIIISAVLVSAGGLAWMVTRSPEKVAIEKPTSAQTPAPASEASSPPSNSTTPKSSATTSEQALANKMTYEKLATLVTSLELNPQERAAFAGTTLVATQAQSRFDTGDFEASSLRWREAAQNLGRFLAPKLDSAYDAEAVALRGLNLAEYSGQAVKALGEALARADIDNKSGDLAKSSQYRHEARGLIGQAQLEIAAQLNEAAKNAAARGDLELATYFYERVLRLDANQPAALSHLYLHKFKAGAITRTSTGLELAYVPPGYFTQGSPAREPGRSSDESPRIVNITRGFFIGVKEVTQRDWDAVFGAGAAASTLLATRTVTEAKSTDGWIGPDLPMHSLRWQDAVEFCRRLSAQEKRIFRLPTEAEWEYACRAGTVTAFNTGGDGISARDANIDDGSAQARYALAQASDAGKANRYGLRDMHGNVWEWCADWSAPYPAGTAPLTDPTGPSDSEAGRLDVAMKVVRGGGWNASASDARSANRAESSPVVGLGYIGLRVVQEPPLVNP